MRFGRRRNRPSLNLTPDILGNGSDVNPQCFTQGCWVLRFNSPLSVLQSSTNRPTDAEGVRQYVPKCITSVSQSEILCGNRVENFSADCWLQNHLDQFGNNIEPTSNPQIAGENDPDYDDDSPVSSISSTEVNSLNSFDMDNMSFEEETVNRLYYAYRHLTDIGPYNGVIEPPPYGCPDLPPSYEEAIAGDQRRGSVSTTSGSSEVDFMWY